MSWTRITSRTQPDQEYLYNPTTGESKWCTHGGPVARAYDTMAQPVTSQGSQESQESRNLRRHNNDWKRQLLDRCLHPGDDVLDLACGRGGDLGKFLHARVASYVGVDVSPACVQEARRRAATLVMAATARITVCDLAHERIPCDDRSRAVVSCQFALHYLAGDRDHIRSMLREVARVMRPRGFFLVTILDHTRVRAILLGQTAAPACMVITPGPRAPLDDDGLARNPWGHAYGFEFRGRTPHCTEYLVFPPALEDEAQRVGLRLQACEARGIYVAYIFQDVSQGVFQA